MLQCFRGHCNRHTHVHKHTQWVEVAAEFSATEKANCHQVTAVWTGCYSDQTNHQHMWFWEREQNDGVLVSPTARMCVKTGGLSLVHIIITHWIGNHFSFYTIRLVSWKTGLCVTLKRTLTLWQCGWFGVNDTDKKHNKTAITNSTNLLVSATHWTTVRLCSVWNKNL